MIARTAGRRAAGKLGLKWILRSRVTQKELLTGCDLHALNCD